MYNFELLYAAVGHPQASRDIVLFGDPAGRGQRAERAEEPFR
jgi:hypothetical protein